MSAANPKAVLLIAVDTFHLKPQMSTAQEEKSKDLRH